MSAQATIVPFAPNPEPELLIDLRAVPEMENGGGSIRSHAHKEYDRPWDFKDIILMPVTGPAYDTLAAFEGVLVVNANPIKPILASPKAVPTDWQNVTVYFPGTVYADKGGREYLRGIKFEFSGAATEVRLPVSSRFPNPKAEKIRFAVYQPR